MAIAHSRRVVERNASAGRIAVFAGVDIETAEAALLRSKDDVAVATQMIMKNKLARESGKILAAVRSNDHSHCTDEPRSAAKFVLQDDIAEVDGTVPSSQWQSTTAQRDRQRQRSAAAVATAARAAKEQRSGAWVPVGFHVDILEKKSISNDRKQLSC